LPHGPPKITATRQNMGKFSADGNRPYPLIDRALAV